MPIRSPFAIALALVIFGGVAGAQDGTRAVRPANGSRVRLLMSGETTQSGGHYMVDGTLVGGDSTRAVVQQPGHAASDTVPMFTVDRFEVYAGQHSRKKMVLGAAAAGAGISLVIRGMDNLTRGSRCEKGCSTPLIPGYAYAAPIVLGAFIGSVFPATHWKSVPRDAIVVGLAPARGLQLASTIHFR